MGEEWHRASFRDCLTRVDRKVLVNDATEYECVGVRWYGNGAFVRERRLGMDIARKQQWVVEEGDVIYNKLFAWKGAFAVADRLVHGRIVSDKFPTYRPIEGVLDHDYLKWWFRGPDVARQAEAMSKGAAAISKLTLNPPQFWDLTVPLPPLVEQRRIVARVEALAAKVEEAQRLRRAAAAEVEAFANSRARQILSFPNVGWVPIEAVAQVRGGIQKTPSRTAAGSPVRYLTVAHVQRDRVLVGDPRYFEVTADELDRWRLESGDVLVIEGNGSADQIGRTALFRGEIQDCVHQNHVIRIRTDRRLAEPEFINAFLNSPVGRDTIQAESRTTSGLRTLSVGRINRLSVPLPPLAEQRSRLVELGALKEQIGSLQILQAETATEIHALLPSLLDRAFKGEL